MTVRSILVNLAKSIAEDLFNGTKARTKKLENLRGYWDKLPRGTAVAFDFACTMCQVQSGGNSSPGQGKILGWHTAKRGQGAMLMNIYWPVVLENRQMESCIRFVFWCNHSHYEYLINLTDYNGTLPFHVLV